MMDTRQKGGILSETKPKVNGAFTKSFMKRTMTPWPHYACDWSQNSSNFCTLAVGSFLPSRQNYVQVLSLAERTDDEFTVVADALPVDYVATKLLWSPSKVKNSEYLAASGDGVYIWKVSTDDGSRNNGNFTLTGRLISRQAPRRSTDEDSFTRDGSGEGNPPAPVTSFDWNRLDPTLLVTASYDTTCTVWCLETGAIKTQLIAHDKEVFDVSFSPISTDTFVSVGADGSLRLFDVR
jgi:WD repeat-containing protein 68